MHSPSPRHIFGRERRPVVALTALLAALAMTAAACGGTDTDTASPTVDTATTADPIDGGHLNVALMAESNGWSPANDLWAQSGYFVGRTFFDPLMAYDADSEIEPYLAESVEATNDEFTEWVITLRDGIDFHDGTPLDADALVTHFEAMRASAIWSQFFGPIESVVATGPAEVTISMNEPFATFPHLLTIQPGYVAAPAQYEDEDGARNPIGTGPFVFDEWVIDDQLRVSKNADYWQEGLPHLDVIEFRVLTDSETRRGSLESGDVDMAEIRDPSTLASLENDSDLDLYIAEGGETAERSVFLNSAAPPFDNENARLAVAHAMDKDLLSRTVFEGRFPAANGPFEEDSPWYQDVQFPVYDPDLAKQYAEAYEEETGENLSFTVQLLADPFSVEQAQLIQQMMDQAGIEMGIQSTEATVLLVNGVTGDYQAMTQELLFGSQHPDREYPFLHSPVDGVKLSVNLTNLDNADIDEGIETARQTGDRESQITAWKQVQEGLADANTVVFLVHVELGLGTQTWVEGVRSPLLPSGNPALPQTQTIPWLTQIWIDQ